MKLGAVLPSALFVDSVRVMWTTRRSLRSRCWDVVPLWTLCERCGGRRVGFESAAVTAWAIQEQARYCCCGSLTGIGTDRSLILAA